MFVTNNSAARIEEHVAALERIGVRADGDVISSSTAAALLIEAGERVLVTGGPGVVQAVEQRGGVAVLNEGGVSTGDDDVGAFDVVIVGLHRDFDYRRLATAAAALHGGARLIGTNSTTRRIRRRAARTRRWFDRRGGGCSGESAPTFAGKPHAPMAAAIAALLGDEFDPATTLMVGDRLGRPTGSWPIG